jgi:ribosomal protein S18 acetylase RimI-like enzyme
MQTEFRKAVLPDDLRSLVAFDRRLFPSDCFSAAQWRHFDAYWMLVNRKRVGCCAFWEHVDFQEDTRPDGMNPREEGTLYIVSTGISTRFQQKGFGQLLKAWQVAYARCHGFRRIVTNTRKRNTRMIRLNQKFHFQILRTTPRYYSNPTDATVVMELLLNR